MKKDKGSKRIITAIFIFVFAFASSCDEGAVENKVDEETLNNIEAKLDEVDSKRALLVESIIRSSPTIAETAEIFAELGSDFNRDYLNGMKNYEYYTTLKDMGVNLGIYLADLAYISTYEQSQEVYFYMNSAQKLAEGIGVNDVFDETTVERLEMNISDKDSIIGLISELYWKTDEFLKELNRENISALIICGGWIEGMHIGSKMIADGYDDDIIYDKILSQRNNLIKIIRLLDTFEGDENIDNMKARLTEIETEYANITPKENKAYTPEQKESINKITEKLETLRNELNQV